MNYKHINTYKNNIIKFIQTKQSNLLDNLQDIDYLYGILFLTELNRYCKICELNIHGYYIAFTLIYLFNNIRLNNLIKLDNIIHLFKYLGYHIDYLNKRIVDKNNIKNKINNNIGLFLVKVSEILDNLIIDSTINNNNLFILLLYIAKFMGSGNYIDPNLDRIAYYYSNIFYTYILILKNKKSDNITEIIENYYNNKNNLNYSLIELNLDSITISEIIDYIDNYITNNIA